LISVVLVSADGMGIRKNDRATPMPLHDCDGGVMLLGQSPTCSWALSFQ
jgi:hypothetical protein